MEMETITIMKLLNQNKMRQTAVEWIGKELESYGDSQFCEIEWEQLDSLIQQAKQMEKEQVKDAYEKGKKYKKPIKDSNPIWINSKPYKKK